MTEWSRCRPNYGIITFDCKQPFNEVEHLKIARVKLFLGQVPVLGHK